MSREAGRALPTVHLAHDPAGMDLPVADRLDVDPADTASEGLVIRSTVAEPDSVLT